MELYLLLHILSASIGKVLSIPWAVVLASSLLHQCGGKAHRTWPIRPDTLDAARVHLLEANGKNTICRSISDQRPGQVQARRASRARVVRVVDWNRCHAELVEDALS